MKLFEILLFKGFPPSLRLRSVLCRTPQLHRTEVRLDGGENSFVEVDPEVQVRVYRQDRGRQTGHRDHHQTSQWSPFENYNQKLKSFSKKACSSL